MKNKIFKLISIIVLTILISTTILPLLNYTHAVSKLKPGETTKDISRINRTLYPGLVERVQVLKKKYPNWEFEFYKTGLDWDRFIALEYSPERDGVSRSPYNLVYYSYKGTWICEYRGTKRYDSGPWYAASYQAIEYSADPRSYLNEFDVFSLKRASDKANSLSEAESIKIINDAIAGSNYLKYAKSIYTISKAENVDFIDVLARLLQEQGSGTVLTAGSKSVDATDPKLYYNPFNIGASGNTATQVLANGIRYAKNNGWDSFAKGLRGGIQKVKTDYQEQNTSYFEKFNSTKPDYSGISHQYMQNITAPFSEGENKKDLYKEIDSDLKGGAYTFVVPLYENMQKAATDAPNHYLATPKGKPYVHPVDPKLPAYANLATSLNLRTSPGTDSTILDTYRSGTLINVLKKEANDWYHVEIDSSGRKGYMAKKVPGSLDYFNFQFTQNATMYGKIYEHRQAVNQDNPSIPRRAETNYRLSVRNSPSLKGSVISTLPFKALISVREEMTNADGYTWYKILYNFSESGSGFSSTGYIARNKLNSKDYYFAYLDYINTTIPEPGEPGEPVTPVTPAPTDPVGGAKVETAITNQKNPALPSYAVLNYAVSLRRGSGSLSSAIIRTLPKDTRISVRGKVANKDGYEWYRVFYNWNGKGFDNSGYMARNKVGSTSYNFKYVTNPDWTKCAYLLSLKPITPVTPAPTDPVGGAKVETAITNQKNPALPSYAVLNYAVSLRRGSGSLSSAIIRTLPKDTRISVRGKVANKDGYEWYRVFYNWNGKGFDNSGYMARNKVGSTSYNFKYVTNPDWTKCAYLLSLKPKTTTPTKPTTPVNQTTTTLPRRGTTTVTLNVRRGSGSLSAPIITRIPSGSPISVRKRMADKDGYTWYLIYYNLVNGKFQNSGYVSRNALRSTSYYFNYN